MTQNVAEASSRSPQKVIKELSEINQMEGTSKRLYEFGRFRLDADELVLLDGDVPVSLAPKTIDVLVALVAKAGHIVSKDELMESVWGDSFVEEANLTQTIFVLRKALGESRTGPKFIETVPRRGYRFVHPVQIIADEFSVVRYQWPRALASERVEPRAEETFSQKWKSFFAPIGLLTVLIIAVGLATNNFYRSESQSVEAPRIALANVQMRRLTSDSRAYSPAISPDGRLFAYKRIDENTESVWLKDIAKGSDIQIRPTRVEGYTGLTFSPDGSELYYSVRSKIANDATLAVIVRSPVFGGVEKKVAENPWSDFALSPDGRNLAFVRSSGKLEGDRVLVVVDTDTGDERVVAKSEHGSYVFSLWAASPAWSPDGKSLVVCGQKRDGADYRAALFNIRAEDGSISEIPTPGWNDVFRAVWFADGTGLITSARETANAPYQIWSLNYPSGEARRVTNDLNNYGQISFAPHSETLIAQQEIRNSHIWIVPDGDTNRAKQLTSGTNVDDGTYGIAWTPDGRVIFSSNRGGGFDLWTIKTDGSELSQVTANAGGNYFPRVSADRRYIVFVSDRAGNRNLWRMDADGSNLVQLTNGGGETWPSISPDSKSIYFSNATRVPTVVEKVSIDGGEPVSVPNESFGAAGPVVSNDGKFLAYFLYSEKLGRRTGILPAQGGTTIKFLELQGARGKHEWTPDSQGLIFIKPASLYSNLWRESLDGKQVEQVTHFTDGHIYYFAYSPDRRHVALARGDSFSDIVLIENFR